MTTRTQNRRSSEPGRLFSTPRHTSRRPELDPASPPITGNAKLDACLKKVSDRSLEPEDRRAAQLAATWLSVKEGEGEALEWLSLYDTAENSFRQEGATLNLAAKGLYGDGERAYLNTKDREFISAWLAQRTHSIPISLDLSCHRFTTGLAHWLAGLLDESASGPSGRHSPLRSLTIDYCRLAEEHMAEISKGIGRNNSVEELRYRRTPNSHNHDKQLVALARGLLGNQTLQTLDLSGHLSKRGLGDICEALTGNSQLRKLDISLVAGTTSDARALGKLLKSTQSLQVLDIGSTRFKAPGTFNGEKGKQWLLKPGKRQELKREAIKKINSLRHKPPASSGMFQGLAQNRSLTTLKIDGFAYEDLEAKALASFIGSSGCRLQMLKWCQLSPKVSDESRAALDAAIQRNQTLIKVEIPFRSKKAVCQNALDEVAQRNGQRLRNQARPAMSEFADRALQLPGGFNSDVAAEILSYLTVDDRHNLALARLNITTAPDGANNDGLADARKHR